MALMIWSTYLSPAKTKLKHFLQPRYHRSSWLSLDLSYRMIYHLTMKYPLYNIFKEGQRNIWSFVLDFVFPSHNPRCLSKTYMLMIFPTDVEYKIYCQEFIATKAETK